MDFLREEINNLIKKSKKNNLALSLWSIQSSWASTNQLLMYFKALEDLVNLKVTGKWDWDFVINLSESDFPIK
jgi:protein xylosyltransferase